MTYLHFDTSEGIADRGEVSYETWEAWQRESAERGFVFGPYKHVRAVYNTLQGVDEDGDFEDIAWLVDDPEDPYHGYWVVVRKVIRQRDPKTGRPRGWSYERDPRYPPFSDWWTDEGTYGHSPRTLAERDPHAAPLPAEAYVAQGAH